ncbi:MULTISPECIES: PEP-CTERM sorting domain-containing protein [unclassified Schlesneria]|uniref:PEP-CTERM sorting domain-containing protein n=1 Tax=unclassified Schlesneria TaxID=2762017 RepID=UPI002F055358
MTFVLVLFGQQSSVVAGIVPDTVVIDEPLKLEVTWYGKGILDDGSNNDSLAVPVLTNWSVGPNPITLTYLGGGDGWFGKLTGQHTTEPHPGEGMGPLVQFMIAFDQLTPTSTSTTKSVLHGTHTDVYTLTYTYNPATDTVTFDLKAAHVPEPTSFALLGVGALGLIGARYRRNKAK